jgi:hypothetical protein
MSPVDPNMPTQQASETNANFAARLQDYLYKTGAGGSGPAVAMAKTWVDPIVNNPAPKGFDIK